MQEVGRQAYEYLKARPGESVHFKTIAERLEFDNPATVNSALYNASRNHPEYGIVKSTGGFYSYELRSAPKRERRAPEVYTEVGTSQSGDSIVKDTKGKLYVQTLQAI